MPPALLIRRASHTNEIRRADRTNSTSTNRSPYAPTLLISRNHTDTHAHTRTHACMHAHTPPVPLVTCGMRATSRAPDALDAPAPEHRNHTCRHTSVDAHEYACIHVCIFMCMCVCVCVYACVHLRACLWRARTSGDEDTFSTDSATSHLACTYNLSPHYLSRSHIHAILATRQRLGRHDLQPRMTRSRPPLLHLDHLRLLSCAQQSLPRISRTPLPRGVDCRGPS